MRPSASSTWVGYQRPWRMLAWRRQVSVIGSNVKIVFRPSRRPIVPPITSTVPSLRNDCPAQKMLAGSFSPSAIRGGKTALVVFVMGSSR